MLNYFLTLVMLVFASINADTDDSSMNNYGCQDMYAMNVQIPASLHVMIETLYRESGNDAYQLSMPLLAASLAANQELYKQILPTIIGELNLEQSMRDLSYLNKDVKEYTAKSNKSASFLSWLLGRVLMAEDGIKDYGASAKTALMMQAILEDPKTPKDAFSAWAWAYLTSHFACQSDYESFKEKMMQATDQLIKDIKTNDDKVNSMWALVMDLQPAALSQDQAGYQSIKKRMLQVTGKANLSDALMEIPAADYRAWAQSLVRLASARIDDKDTFDALATPVAKEIETQPAGGNKVLALLNNILSEFEWNRKHS